MMAQDKQAVVFQDPKTAVIITFNNEMQKIFEALNQSVALGGTLMLNFILRLRIIDNEENKKIKFIQDNLNMEYGIGCSVLYPPTGVGKIVGMSSKEIWEIWRELNNYMNGSYFKGFEFGGKPQESRPLGRGL